MAGGRPSNAGSASPIGTYGYRAGSSVGAEADRSSAYGTQQQEQLQKQGSGAYTNLSRLADMAQQREQANATSQQAQYGAMATGAQNAANAMGQRAYNRQDANAVQAQQMAGRLNLSLQNQGARAAALGAQQGGALASQGGALMGQSGQYGQQATQSYGMQASDRAQQLQSLDALRSYSQQGPGPSAAEAQLQQASDASMAQSVALARSGRGAGDNAAAMRNAQFQNAATMQQTGGQMANLRAQEAATWRAQQLQALGAAQEGAGAMRGQDVSAMGAAAGAQGQMAGIGANLAQAGAGTTMQGAQLQQGYSQAGTQAALQGAQLGQGYAQLGQGAEQAYAQLGAQQGEAYNQLGAQQGLAYNQLGSQEQQAYTQQANDAALKYAALGQQAGQFGESGRQSVLGAQLQSDTARTTNQVSNATQYDIEQKKRDQEGFAAGLSATASLASSMGAAMSDEDNKVGIEPAYEVEDRHDMAIGSGRLTDKLWAMSGKTHSDKNSKKDVGSSSEPLRMLDDLVSYRYRYRDPNEPGAAHGQQFGIMAQDLEKSEAGRSVVRDTPSGKMVDTNHLTLINTAALADMQREIEALRAGREKR